MLSERPESGARSAADYTAFFVRTIYHMTEKSLLPFIRKVGPSSTGNPTLDLAFTSK